MIHTNKVFIATSIDGYITDRNLGLNWLHSIPNPENNDMGYAAFMEGIDAIIMGRKTFETVCSFDIEWPYTKPTFVLSTTLHSIPESHREKVQVIHGSLPDILTELHTSEYKNLYIDGGSTIQNFLKEDLIDELTLTTIPILLGGGIRLFRDLPIELTFEHKGSTVFLGEIVQTKYVRRR